MVRVVGPGEPSVRSFHDAHHRKDEVDEGEREAAEGEQRVLNRVVVKGPALSERNAERQRCR